MYVPSCSQRPGNNTYLLKDQKHTEVNVIKSNYKMDYQKNILILLFKYNEVSINNYINMFLTWSVMQPHDCRISMKHKIEFTLKYCSRNFIQYLMNNWLICGFQCKIHACDTFTGLNNIYDFYRRHKLWVFFNLFRAFKDDAYYF